MRSWSPIVNKNRSPLLAGDRLKKESNALLSRRMVQSCARWWATTAWLGNTPIGNSPSSTERRVCLSTALKLLSKQHDGKKVRYVYDPAKTPLQRLLLSGILPAHKQQELLKVAQALDPIRLFEQLEQLQQAVFHCAAGCSSSPSSLPSAPIRAFSDERGMTEKLPVEEIAPDPTVGFEALYREQERRKRVLGWRRTHKDPFEGEWEQIFTWLQTNPERSSGDIFRELQRRTPGRYQPLQIRTLQRGMRKIRAYLLETSEEQWQDEVIHSRSFLSISTAARPIGSDAIPIVGSASSKVSQNRSNGFIPSSVHHSSYQV